MHHLSLLHAGHHRKKYYTRLCELSLKMGRPEVAFAIFGNLQRFQIATYFARETVQGLAALGAPAPILMRIAELTKMQVRLSTPPPWHLHPYLLVVVIICL